MRKSGNLRHAFSVTTGEAFVVFDADFCPRPDFLRETVPHLTDPSIGILQTPQYFSRRPHQTWVEQGAGVCQELFYRMEQVMLFGVCREGATGRICVRGFYHSEGVLKVCGTTEGIDIWGIALSFTHVP